MKKVLTSFLSAVMTFSFLVNCTVSQAAKETTTKTTLTTTSTIKSSQSVKTTVSSSFSTSTTETAYNSNNKLSNEQKNSIAWLNYLAAVSQEIISYSHNKIYLDEIYSELMDNSNAQSIDKSTLKNIKNLLESIKDYRMIETKRKRLQYIYEQNKAAQIRNLIPESEDLFNSLKIITKGNLFASIAAIIHTAVDTAENYISYGDKTELEYLQSNWELNDKADETLNKIRENAFGYMVDMVNKNNLDDKMALRENTVDEFVKFKNNDNIAQQIRFFENNKNTYQYFGSYWLLLAECYHKNKEYQKCLDCIDEYENLGCKIFVKDHNLAKALTFAIASAAEIQPESTYINTAEKYLKLIKDNIGNDEWELKYFEALTYIDLYVRTGKNEYLKSAYDITLDNITCLADRQKELNNNYLETVETVKIEKDMTKREKKQIEDYNDSIKEKRKTELPEIYEPLALNCDLLFSVADKINLSQSDKKEIDDILAVNSDNPVFWTEPVRNKFSFSPSKTIADNAKFNHDRIILPVSIVSENSKIKVTVTRGDNIKVYEDWKVTEIKRSDDNFSSFTVKYESDEADFCHYQRDSVVKVEILNEYSEPVILNFKVISLTPMDDGRNKARFEQIK